MFDRASSDTPGNRSPRRQPPGARLGPPRQSAQAAREWGWGPARSRQTARSGVGAPRQAAKPPEDSVPVGDRDLEVLADGAPDVLGRLPLGERLLHGALAQPADDLVAGDRVGV